MYGPIRTVVQGLAVRLPPYADQLIKYPVLKLPQRPKIQIQRHPLSQAAFCAEYELCLCRELRS